MHISREEFLAQQAEKNNSTYEGPYVGFLKIENGGEAVVRFAYDSPDQMDIIAFHLVTEPGKPEYQGKRYNCQRDSFSSPISDCPLCESKVPMKQKVFLKLIEYTRDENDNIVATPKIWERSTKWVTKISQLFEEYGNVSDYVFKIKRTGSGLETTYSDPMLANPTIYNADNYPKDFSAFDDYKIIGGIINDTLPGEEDTKTEEPRVEVPKTTTPRRVTY